MVSALWRSSHTGAHVAHQVFAAWPCALTPREQEGWGGTMGVGFLPPSPGQHFPQDPAWEAISRDAEGTPCRLPGLPVNS